MTTPPLSNENNPIGSNSSSQNSANNSIQSEKTRKEKKPVTAGELWALGIAIVIGGQYFGWNAGLAAGFGSYAIITMLMGSAYSCLIFCTSEISSGLPFAGGAYGLARVSLGFYFGFVIGCSEAIEYIIYTATSAIALGNMILTIFEADESYAPLIWLLFYASALSIHIYGGKSFWIITYILSVASIVIFFMYCLGSLKYANFDKYAGYVTVISDPEAHNTDNMSPSYFIGGGHEFMRCFFYAAWFYVGVESLAFASDVTYQPKRNLPRGSISCMMTLLATSILVLFICSSVASFDGLSTSTTFAAFNPGFTSFLGLSNKAALWLSIPATYATAYGFMFPYGKLLESLSSSNLLPTPLQWTTSQAKTPYVALIVGSAIGYFVCLIVYFVPYFGVQLFNICVLSAFLGYISQCIGYIAMQTKFANIKREFHSPFGVYGAIYAMLVFGMGVISVIGFQDDNQFALICVVVMQALLSLYYFGYAKKHQTFSPEESKIMFVAHVITHNTTGARKRTSKKAQKISSSKAMISMSTAEGGQQSRFKSLMKLSKIASEDGSTYQCESEKRKLGLPLHRKIVPVNCPISEKDIVSSGI